MKIIAVSSLLVIALGAVINADAQVKGFKTDPVTGVQYRFIKHNAKGIKPTEDDFGRIVMVWKGKNTKGDADSVFLDSHLKGGDSAGVLLQSIPLKKTFKGSLEQGILMMAVGDSAIFHINSDSLLMKTFHYPAGRPFPGYMKSNPTFTFCIKLVSFQTADEMKAARQMETQKKMAQVQARKTEEPAIIAAYLKKNNLQVTPDTDSIFYLSTTPGNGAHVSEGDSLEIKYKGMFLDGTVFDQSDHGTGKGTFSIKYTQHVPLIKGWISVLGKMTQGEKVTVLIPSPMAYGPRGARTIPPYTPLIFDIEIVNIKSNK